MNKILKSALAIIAVATIATTATVSYFSDTEEMTGLTFSSGNADLMLTQKNMSYWMHSGTAADLGVTLPDDLYPGYEGTWGNPDGTIYLGNFSDSPIDLVVKAKITNYTEDFAGLGDKVQLAMAWGGNCDPNGLGTGFHTLNWWQNNSETLFTGSGSTCGYIPNDHSGNYTGYSKFVKFYLKVPTSVGNEIEGSKGGFNIQFDAEQKH